MSDLSPEVLAAVERIDQAESDEEARRIEADLLVETKKQPEDPGVDGDDA